MSDLVKTPAFPFFGKDAYDDETFAALSWAAKAVWQWLAWWQWQEGSIPADIERVVDKCPYRLVDGLREAWPEVLPLFSARVDGGKRLRDPHVELRRAKVAEGRLGRQRGAAVTNEKRKAKANKGDAQRTLTDTVTVTPSARSALQVQVQEEVASSPGGVERGESAIAIAARIMPLIENSAMDPPPPPQLVVAWLSDWDEQLIRETLVDCEPEYAGKSYKYFERIVATRKANPNQRPAARRKGRTDERNGTDRRRDHSRGAEESRQPASGGGGAFAQADARAAGPAPET